MISTRKREDHIHEHHSFKQVDYGVRVGGVKELGTLANSILHPRASNDRWSLSDLVLRFLRQELLKPKHIRVGNWETKPLRPGNNIGF